MDSTRFKYIVVGLGGLSVISGLSACRPEAISDVAGGQAVSIVGGMSAEVPPASLCAIVYVINDFTTQTIVADSKIHMLDATRDIYSASVSTRSLPYQSPWKVEVAYPAHWPVCTPNLDQNGIDLNQCDSKPKYVVSGTEYFTYDVTFLSNTFDYPSWPNANIPDTSLRVNGISNLACNAVYTASLETPIVVGGGYNGGAAFSVSTAAYPFQDRGDFLAAAEALRHPVATFPAESLEVSAKALAGAAITSRDADRYAASTKLPRGLIETLRRAYNRAR